jgi:hypothetical protein
MSFFQTLAAGLTVALVMGLPVFWYREQAMFRAVGRVFLVVLGAAFFLGLVFTVGYQAGTYSENERDSKVISSVQHTIWDVLHSDMEKGSAPSEGEKTIIKAVPVTLDSPPLFNTLFVIPSWLWGCCALLMLELFVLTNMSHTRSAETEPASKSST